MPEARLQRTRAAYDTTRLFSVSYEAIERARIAEGLRIAGAPWWTVTEGRLKRVYPDTTTSFVPHMGD